MSIRKYGLLTIILWFFAFTSSITFYWLGIFQSGNQPINALTAVYLGMALVLIALYLFQRKQGAPLEFEKKPMHWVLLVAIGFLSIWGALFLQLIVNSIESAISGELTVSENTQNLVTLIKSAPIFLLATAVGGPIMEEFVFRRAIPGIIASFPFRFTNFWVGAVISSIIFAFAHSDGHLAVYFFLGMFFCFLFKKTGSIWTPIIAHAGMNALVLFAQILLQNLT
ncbi:CPBP family intramembrane glutamic endopeptidase [Enterococcus sp. HY326]|uniref:CPBP family intramembrane glutamic endopeptidase n=1 Tax=Enterococcus sp. HY326 TaxID=2971265 RepID=UPI0022401C05|nr:type II CAAX endopeptidase family protein [Enterococcus sp. HY326]